MGDFASFLLLRSFPLWIRIITFICIVLIIFYLMFLFQISNPAKRNLYIKIQNMIDTLFYSYHTLEEMPVLPVKTDDNETTFIITHYY
jgi:hypothetical protein